MSVKVKKTKEVTKPDTHEAEQKSTVESRLQHPLLTLREEVDHLFDNFFSGFALGPFGSSRRDPMHAPAFRRFENAFSGLSSPFEGLHIKADVRESDDVYRIQAELPGMEESDIEVSATDGMLTITGEKNEETKDDKEDYHLTERHYGSVKRSFPIPDGVELTKAKASFKNGVLNITIPKQKLAKSKAKKIPISDD